MNLFFFLTVLVFSNLTGSVCNGGKFHCPIVNQCIPKSFYCPDCLDWGEGANCSEPTIEATPPKFLSVETGGSFVLHCRDVRVPTSNVTWTRNYGHVPSNCNSTRLVEVRRLTHFIGYKVIISTTIFFLCQSAHYTVLTILFCSIEGLGTLTCHKVKPTDEGIYTCSGAGGFYSALFFSQDTILNVIDSSRAFCSPPKNNSAISTPAECQDCYCFGITKECFSPDLHFRTVCKVNNAN